MGKKKGCPIKLTPEIQKTLCDLLRVGMYINVSCQMARISEKTFYNWMERGKAEAERVEKGQRSKEPEFYSFLQSVTQAMAEFEARALVSIDKAANGRGAEYDRNGKLIRPAIEADWKAATWLLERKFPDRWGKRDQIKMFEAEKGEDFKPETGSTHSQIMDLIDRFKKTDNDQD
jgi:transposase